jgi:tripartite-type tricarboxylate transporter receptor subunit TctC
MIWLRRTAAALLAAWLTAPMLAAPAAAQDFPTRTVRIVVAFPAGGPTDFVGRLLADKLKSLLGQSVVVENRPGANGAIGAEYVAAGSRTGTSSS